MMMITQVIRATLNAAGAGDPDAVLTARIRSPVEPAVARLDLEAALVEEHSPLGRGEPGERHRRRLAVSAAHREGERPLRGIPVRPFEDPGLALEPAAVSLGDVVGSGGENVEHEATVR